MRCTLNSATLPATGILAAFVVLVIFGISGSSLNLGYTGSPVLDTSLSLRMAGQARPIRTDEWLVATPLAISQTTHSPKFPIVNKNLGVDGQNMLVVGSGGAPVAHISALARPATWGFFVLDLKRALAWYWWFPLFGCLFALWGVFDLVFPGRWKLGLALSMWFCLSAYVAAWSYWPAYAVFFPSLALWSAIQILRGNSVYVLSLALGLALAGFVLMLYPPWQVSLGYLFLLLGISLILRDKLYRNLDASRLIALGMAFVVAAVIIWMWWIDARQAIQIMLDTIYPGERTRVLGGGETVAYLLRGTTNIASLYKVNGNPNQCEVASFVFLFAPLLFALIANCCALSRVRLIEGVLLGFVGYVLVFAFVGVPEFVAKWSLWGRVPELRLDLVLGVAYIMLCGLVLTSEAPAITSFRLKTLAYLVASSWAVFLVYTMHQLPAGVLVGLTPVTEATILIAAFLGGLWLIQGKTNKFIALNIACSFVTVFAFNPMVEAPKEVKVATQLQSVLQQSPLPSPNRPRVLVLADTVSAMYLLAAGVPVANGVFYYPQPALWKNLDPTNQSRDAYNRYQHLIFVPGEVKPLASYYIETPQPDVVRVVVAPERFRFSLTGAQVVVAPTGVENQLKQNSNLAFVRQAAGWSWFDVK